MGQNRNVNYIKLGFGAVATHLGLACRSMATRGIYLRTLKFYGKIGLIMFPWVYQMMDRFNQEYSSSQRVKEKYRDKAKIRRFLRKAEQKKLSDAAILSGMKNIIGEEFSTEISLDEVFEDADRDQEVAIQFSGGCDSTLIAMLSAKYFRKVHLLSFTHAFIEGAEKSILNAQKLISIFGAEKVTFNQLDTTKMYHKFLFENYDLDVRKFGTFVIGVGCLACKLSFDESIIKYSLENNIRYILDGADLSVKTQLSQGNEAVLNERWKLYRQYGLEFMHPAVKFKNNAYMLVKLGLELKPRTIFYAHQPECIGNQFLNEIHDRFYFIPKHGVELHTAKALLWLEDKLKVCHDSIKESIHTKQHLKTCEYAKADSSMPFKKDA